MTDDLDPAVQAALDHDDTLDLTDLDRLSHRTLGREHGTPVGDDLAGQIRAAIAASGTVQEPEAPAQPERVAQADLRVIAEATQRGWTADDLFEWLNSKHGRWFGDLWFGGSDDEDTERHTPGLMTLPGDGDLS